MTRFPGVKQHDEDYEEEEAYNPGAIEHRDICSRIRLWRIQDGARRERFRKDMHALAVNAAWGAHWRYVFGPRPKGE